MPLAGGPGPLAPREGAASPRSPESAFPGSPARSGAGYTCRLGGIPVYRSKDVARQPPEPQRTPACHGFGKRYSRLDWPVPRALQGPCRALTPGRIQMTQAEPHHGDDGAPRGQRVVLRQGAAKSLCCLRVG